MNFGDALKVMRDGGKMERKGWNGKDLHIQLQEPTLPMTLPYLSLHYPTGMAVPWAPSQTDVLAEDWAAVIQKRKSDL